MTKCKGYISLYLYVPRYGASKCSGFLLVVFCVIENSQNWGAGLTVIMILEFPCGSLEKGLEFQS